MYIYIHTYIHRYMYIYIHIHIHIDINVTKKDQKAAAHVKLPAMSRNERIRGHSWAEVVGFHVSSR